MEINNDAPTTNCIWELKWDCIISQCWP